ncbi:MAG: MFS transporter [Acetobacteraceae bacterium]|nr:MFS transporter [Acetobacteraceae bacterium]
MMIEPDSRAAWSRLLACVALSTIGGAAMWSVVVIIPSIQAEWGLDRGFASIAYTACMLGFAFGSVLTGAISDRWGIRRPLLAASAILAAGFALCSLTTDIWQFAALQFAFVGLLGAAATFGPLIAYVSLYFHRRRGLAVSLCASGNYLAGTIWPSVIQHFTRTEGWRATYAGLGLFCAVTMIPLAWSLRGRPAPVPAATSAATPRAAALGLPPALLQGLLILAGLACCIAMATPQVHIVAYCVDLGYGPARGAEMLSAMLGFGIISRLASGWLADRIGGLPTLLTGSVLQGLALWLYINFDGLASLYVISALFGLFQGGIVPSYAVVVRECFPAREAGARVGVVLMATMIGMALGGWMAGAIDAWSGTYRTAFANGLFWNAINVAIVLALLLRSRAQLNPALPTAEPAR